MSHIEAVAELRKAIGEIQASGDRADVNGKTFDLLSLNWLRHVLAYIEFTETHGNRPRRRSSDAAEVKLERWISDQRRRMSLSEARTVVIDKFIPDWRSTYESRWDASVVDLEGFVAAHGRTPSTRSVDPDERRAGMWLQIQRKRVSEKPSVFKPLKPHQATRLLEIPGFAVKSRD